MTASTSSAGIPSEGTHREELAAYFLSMPPIGEQTSAQRQDYLAHLRRLGKLEEGEVRRNAGMTRPLVWGNPVPLLQSFLTAAQRLAAGVGQPLLIFPAKETVIDFETLLHPRILSLGLAGLLRAVCTEAAGQPVWVRLQEQSSCLTLSVTAKESLAHIPSDVYAVVQESARLHAGSLALCDNRIGFSCGRVSHPPADVRPYRSPTASELLNDPFSAVWTGFYAWLDSQSSSSSSTTSTVLEAEASPSSESSPS